MGVGVGMGGTWPNSVEDEVASVPLEFLRDDCCDDEEKWALDCDGIGRGAAAAATAKGLRPLAEAGSALCED